MKKLNKSKVLKYSAGFVGVAAMTAHTNAFLVVKSLEFTVVANSTSYWSISPFTDGALDITLNFDAVLGPNDNLRINSSSDGVYFEGENFGGIDLQMLNTGGTYQPAFQFDPGNTVNAATGIPTENYITVAGNYNRSFYNGFAEDTRDYVGLQLTTSGRTHFGWISFTPNTGDTVTVHDFVIETTQNTGALITAVPEPAQFAFLLASGQLA